ncbi:hypothetical protein GCM10009555_098530 [Acrocarpospora macrocephala]|uniref:Uncharacterized protein n=1 Tax=Acrocarpospora macrocephala TaxID=150177 RepID=A0A5M3WVY8_9ACTN|nr:hypothetical protein [Acrocarpospora macrocephala]GES12566.1 hypothetical protein Amac_061630 [Acrocarpospora macrocephala]
MVAAKVLGVPPEDDRRKVWPPPGAGPPRGQTLADAHRLREHFRPWLGRRLRGTSSGDNVTAERPELIPFETGDI